jgi:hypothetical protein
MVTTAQQSRWRARQRAKGRRPVTIWLDDSLSQRLKQLCQTSAAPQERVLTHSLAWAFWKMPTSYWYNIRTTIEAEQAEREKG